MPTIDIDRDAAHDAAQSELGKPIYPKPSLIEQIYNWIEELLYRLVANGATFPGGWFTVTVLLILLAVAVIVAIRIARRAMRTSRGETAPCSGLGAQRRRASRDRRTLCGGRGLGSRHPSPAAGRRAAARGERDAGPRSGTHGDRAGPCRGTRVTRAGRRISRCSRGFQRRDLRRAPGLESQYRRSPRWTTNWAATCRRNPANPTRRRHPRSGPRCDDERLVDSRRCDHLPAVARRSMGAARARRRRRCGRGERLPDRAATRRPDGSGLDVARRGPRPGHAAARSRCDGRRGRQRRRRGTRSAAGHPPGGGADVPSVRRRTAGPSRGGSWRSSAGRTRRCYPREARAGNPARGIDHLWWLVAGVRSAGSDAGRHRAVRCRRRLRGRRSDAGDPLLRRHFGAVHRRRSHRHRRGRRRTS